VATDETVKQFWNNRNGINNLGKTKHSVCPHIRDREKLCTPYLAYSQEGKTAETFCPRTPVLLLKQNCDLNLRKDNNSICPIIIQNFIQIYFTLGQQSCFFTIPAGCYRLQNSHHDQANHYKSVKLRIKVTVKHNHLWQFYFLEQVSALVKSHNQAIKCT
jgi:hypothetical protein